MTAFATIRLRLQLPTSRLHRLWWRWH